MLTAIGDVMRRCYDKGWITTRDGNISIHDPSRGVLYITPSGVRKNIIHPESIIKLPFKDGEFTYYTDNKGTFIADSDLRPTNPSGELEMHRLLQLDAKRKRCVVHVHATHIVAAIHAGFDLQSISRQFPEISRYTKVGPTVPSLPAVSKELADMTDWCVRGSAGGKLQYDIVGQANHGVAAIASDPWTAYEHCERLDHICEIVLKSGVKP